ncbi:hypothetical protein CRG98_012560 [Punica granatum]|uniref:IBR domain-containing protein n=1 Tax=Punica granatum TaxID=22663 RepID=A0A2I0KET2_PUNGR|nr:hypothetical protein CRG98_012560 [Punica granatum]
MDAQYIYSSASSSSISPPATNSSAGYSRSGIDVEAKPLHFPANEAVSGAAAAAAVKKTLCFDEDKSFQIIGYLCSVRRTPVYQHRCYETFPKCGFLEVEAGQGPYYGFLEFEAGQEGTQPGPGSESKHWSYHDHLHRDCSAMLVNDCEKVIEQSECPHCHRLFCAQCRVPWHTGVACMEFQALNEDERGSDDLLLRKLANEKNWRRCKFEFCYGCGSAWSESHGGCARN